MYGFGSEDRLLPCFSWSAKASRRDNCGYVKWSKLKEVLEEARKNPVGAHSNRDLQCHCLGHCMSPIIDIQLLQDLLDVVFDGKWADMK